MSFSGCFHEHKLGISQFPCRSYWYDQMFHIWSTVHLRSVLLAPYQSTRHPFHKTLSHSALWNSKPRVVNSNFFNQLRPKISSSFIQPNSILEMLNVNALLLMRPAVQPREQSGTWQTARILSTFQHEWGALFKKCYVFMIYLRRHDVSCRTS